jgi:hypothetical protein
MLPGRHVVLATDSGGAPVVWDAEADRLASFFWKGGDWEPYNLGFEAFMEALFFRPEPLAAGDGSRRSGSWRSRADQTLHLSGSASGLS